VPQAALSHLQNAAFEAEENLSDAAEVAAGLTAVDGALVLTSDLRVVGFGAEIVLDAAVPVTAYEAIGPGQFLPVDSESFGMRHRSALRCVGNTEGVAAFVVSQDGRVSLFWKQDGRLRLKRNVNTANPNMIGD
jgi:DNA integrity scanning protein DisA with diadenylate cyclase activity